MKSVLFIIFTTYISTAALAQPFYKSYDWDENPKYSTDGISEKSLASVKEKTVTEFYFEEGDLVEYFLDHSVYYLNSDDSIEEYNKIYLPYSSSSNLEVTKARVITKNGKVIVLDDSKILTATDEETNKTYKYFAFEGVEKGSFIEYMYVVKRYPRYKGNRINLQSDYQKNNVEFDLYAPANLLFKFKSYNGLKDVSRDTIIEDKNRWFVKEAKVEALEPEPLSAYNAYKKFLIYALDENLASRTSNITAYSDVAQNIYDYYNKELSRRTESAIEDFLENIDLKGVNDLETKIKRVESYIKTNIYVADASSEKLASLEDILENKIANEGGIIKLYDAIFKRLEIPYEFVYTCERDYMFFDKDFEANNFLVDVLFYFPKTKKYVAPTDNESRYGFPPPYLTDTYGLFMKEVTVGTFTSAIGKIKYIKPIKAENTIDKMIVDVRFDDDDLTNLNIDFTKSMTGYYSVYIHPYMTLLKPEDRTDAIESYAKNLHEDVEIISTEVHNEDPELFGKEPLELIINFESSAFVEKAGRKYLFKVGDLIGPQSELYQEKERKLPVDSPFERSYIRTLNIAIPEGYTFANLDDIKINNAYKKDGKTMMSFDSSYTLENNVLTITADEHYRMNHVSTDIYEDYRTVINSAADFNKITLILEPTE